MFAKMHRDLTQQTYLSGRMFAAGNSTSARPNKNCRNKQLF